MRNRSDCSSVCAAPGWLCSTSSSAGVVTFTPARRDLRTFPRGEKYGVSYVLSSDWEENARKAKRLDDKALLWGYAVRHYKRPGAFIDLLLSPRCRKYARRLLSCEGESALFAFVRKLQAHRGADLTYLDAVIAAPHFAEQRRRWIKYILVDSVYGSAFPWRAVA